MMAQLGMVLYHGIDSGPELRTYGRIAEDMGYDSLWVTERYFHEETFSLLGFLAAATERLRLGVGVVNPYTRHPALLAMGAATLDRISGGRLMLGMGRSERFVIQDRMGIPYTRPRGTLEAAVTRVRALLAGERIDTEAADDTLHFHLRNVGLALQPVQRPLPIYLAAIGPKALQLAGRVADGVVLNAYVPTAYVRYAVAEIRAAAQAAGRDPSAIDIACMLVVRLADDPSGMWMGLKERLVRLLAEAYVGEILLQQGGFDAGILPALRQRAAQQGEASAVGLISDAMVEAFFLVGPAERCRARIAEYQEAGVDQALLLPRLHDYQRVAEALRP
jgi:5,10-methylenetetrahydromethanopterin reductase